jgi:hypothetical protein
VLHCYVIHTYIDCLMHRKPTLHWVTSMSLLLMQLLHVSAPTCHPQVPKHVGAALVINTLTKPSAQCWFSMHNPAMHGTNVKNIKLPALFQRTHIFVEEVGLTLYIQCRLWTQWCLTFPEINLLIFFYVNKLCLFVSFPSIG